MRRLLGEVWPTIVSSAEDPHGPLSPLLLRLTVVTGLVDAFSYLVLGRVFVANMTGNVVFLGFALARRRCSSSGEGGLESLARPERGARDGDGTNANDTQRPFA